MVLLPILYSKHECLRSHQKGAMSRKGQFPASVAIRRDAERIWDMVLCV